MRLELNLDLKERFAPEEFDRAGAVSYAQAVSTRFT